MQRHGLRHRLARALGLALALVCATCGPALATVPTLDIAQLTAARIAGGWSFVAEFEGVDFTSATIQPPVGAPIPLLCEAFGFDAVECLFEDDGFASLAALRTAYPAGTYALSLDGGIATAQLPFDPIEPNGVITVTAPVDGSTDVSATPTISYTHTCANCVAIGFEIVEVEAPQAVGLEFLVFGFPPAASGSIPYATLEPFDDLPKPAELPNGRYALSALAAVGEILDVPLAPGGVEFEYVAAAFLISESSFTVPEPATQAASLAAFGAVAVLARRRRRGVASAARRPRTPREPPGSAA